MSAALRGRRIAAAWGAKGQPSRRARQPSPGFSRSAGAANDARRPRARRALSNKSAVCGQLCGRRGPAASPAARPYTASLLADRPGTTASSSRGRSPARTPVTSPLRVSFDDLAAPVETPTRRTTTKLHVDDGIPHSQKYRTRRSTGPVMTRDLTRAGRQASVNDVGTRQFHDTQGPDSFIILGERRKSERFSSPSRGTTTRLFRHCRSNCSQATSSRNS